MEAEELLSRYAAGERNFSWVDFSKVDLEGDELSEVILRDINLSGADLFGVDFTGSDLSGAIFENADLEGVDFSNSKLLGSNLSGAVVENVDFIEAILDNATLRGIRGGQANFDCASLVNADLSSPSPYIGRETYLPQCSFDRVNFTGANLSRVDFSHSSFNGANFTRTNLRNAVEFFNISDAIFSNTIMPDGSIWYDSIGLRYLPLNVRKSQLIL